MDFNFKYTNRELEISNDNLRMIIYLPNDYTTSYLAYIIKYPYHDKSKRMHGIIVNDKEILLAGNCVWITLDYQTYANKLYNEVIKSEYDEKDITPFDLEILDTYYKYGIVFTDAKDWKMSKSFARILIVYDFNHTEYNLLMNGIKDEGYFNQSFRNGQFEILRKDDELWLGKYELYPGIWYKYLRFIFPDMAKVLIWNVEINYKNLIESMGNIVNQ